MTRDILNEDAQCTQMADLFPKIVGSFQCMIEDIHAEYVLDRKRVLECGSRGLVSFYNCLSREHTQHPDRLCVKMTLKESEAKAILKLSQDVKYRCGQTSAVLMTKDTKNTEPSGIYQYQSTGDHKNVEVYSYVMPYYHGTLYDFVPREASEGLSKTAIISIIDQLLNQGRCLEKQAAFSYQDIKPENILYYTPNEGTQNDIVVAFGDLDSECRSLRCPIGKNHNPRQEAWCQRFFLVVLLAELVSTMQELKKYDFWKYARSPWPVVERFDQDNLQKVLGSAISYLREHDYSKYIDLLDF